jgi:hypothetical protein
MLGREMGLTAAGTDQGTALPVTAPSVIHVFGTVASGTGAVLGITHAPAEVVIANQGANALSVYPPSGGSINGGATNGSFSLAAGLAATFRTIDLSTLTWYTV